MQSVLYEAKKKYEWYHKAQHQPAAAVLGPCLMDRSRQLICSFYVHGGWVEEDEGLGRKENISWNAYFANGYGLHGCQLGSDSAITPSQWSDDKHAVPSAGQA